MSPPEAILPEKMFAREPEKGFKMVLHTQIIIGRLLVSWTINGGRGGH